MGNYRQHLGFATFLGVLYGWGAYVGAGVHWLYGSVAAFFTALGGLLPDVDHPIGVEMKGFSGVLAVLAALAAWQNVRRFHPDLPFEVDLWAVVIVYGVVRHGMRRVFAKMMVHRGISHSLPTCAAWAELMYLYYPSDRHQVRLVMAAAVALGFLSHLILDEVCSVDINGARVNRAFGSALKFWAPSPWSTLAMYGLLSVLTWRVIQRWPDGPLSLEPIHMPRIKWAWPPFSDRLR